MRPRVTNFFLIPINTFTIDNIVNCKTNTPNRIHYIMIKNSKKNTQNATIDLHVCKIYVKFKGENSRQRWLICSPCGPTKYA